jgi:hypothetical protein
MGRKEKQRETDKKNRSKKVKNPALTPCRGGRPFEEKNWMRWGDRMGNSAAFPVIVSNRNAPIGFRWEKALLPNFRKILALARFNRWKNRQSKVDTI